MKHDFTSLPEFDRHKYLSLISDPKSGLRGFIAMHRVNGNIPSFGATRFAIYSSELDAAKEALRLSKLMSYKSALAGLGYGGGKAVLLQNNRQNKGKILKSYANYVNMLSGKFVTGADFGVSNTDVKLLRQNSPFILGVVSDPVFFTALGIFEGIKVSVKEYYGKLDLSDKSVAIQGVGKVGTALLSMLYGKIGQIFVTDLDKKKLRQLLKLYPGVKALALNEIHSARANIFSPCARGRCLNAHTLKQIKSEIIVGGANDQLDNPSIGVKLHKMGLLYAPDYVVNAGGLISVVDEYKNKNFNRDRAAKKVIAIKDTLRKVFSESRKTKKATNIVADSMAEKIFNKIS